MDSGKNPWSNNPNAPKISHGVYFYEKLWYAGNFFSAVLYGIVIAVFFKCMAALFNPDHRRGEPVKWGLVSYTVLMFLLVTAGTIMQLDVQSISYIDNREFPGVEGEMPIGPNGYQGIIEPEPIVYVQDIVFTLNNWLAEGLLLYRCYAVYSMNLWAIAFPCLMFLGSLAMGTAFVYQNARVSRPIWSALPYYSISLSLNILLTLMIVVRLIMHTRNTRTALGISGIGGLCKAIVIMLVESCALYAVNSLLVIGPLGAKNVTWSFFMSAIGQVRVIAPLLIILRVADKSALTSNTIASGRVSEFKVRSRGELTGGGAISGGDSTSSADERGMDSGGLAVGVATHQDRTRGSPDLGTLHG